jgi:hypothetical protein
MKANDETSRSAVTKIGRRGPGGGPPPSSAIPVPTTTGGRAYDG